MIRIIFSVPTTAHYYPSVRTTTSNKTTSTPSTISRPSTQQHQNNMSALRVPARRLFAASPLRAHTGFRTFRTSAPAFVRVGDAIPNINLAEDSPGNTVNLVDEFKSSPNGVIIGVPAAFSGVCTASHVPGYIKHPKLKDAGKVFVVSVNDAFV